MDALNNRFRAIAYSLSSTLSDRLQEPCEVNFIEVWATNPPSESTPPGLVGRIESADQRVGHIFISRPASFRMLVTLLAADPGFPTPLRPHSRIELRLCLPLLNLITRVFGAQQELNITAVNQNEFSLISDDSANRQVARFGLTIHEKSAGEIQIAFDPASFDSRLEQAQSHTPRTKPHTKERHYRPFSFLQHLPPENHSYMQTEMPQTIGLILSHLPPETGALLLSYAPHQEQSSIAIAIANQGAVAYDVLRRLSYIVEAEVSRQQKDLPGGPEKLADIMEYLDRGTELTVTEAIEEEDPELSEELRKIRGNPLDIALLTDTTIAEVWSNLREFERVSLLRYLDNSDQRGDYIAKVLRNLDAQSSRRYEKILRRLGPMQDEQDQFDFLQFYRRKFTRLESSGRIEFPRF